MFGYVIPDKPNMYIKDFAVFRACYCGLCKALGKSGAQVTRFVTNYDMTFLLEFMYALKGAEPKIEKQACILSPKKKPIAVPDAVSLSVADAAVILAYHKAEDDVADGEPSHAMIKGVLKNRYKRAAKRLPETARSTAQNYAKLRDLEGKNCKQVDRLADCFATILDDMVKELSGTAYSDDVHDFAYNLGRWIYFADAVDDLQSDFQRKRFNPLLNDGFVDKKSFLEQNKEEFAYLLRSSYNKIVGAYDQLVIKVCEGVLSNTVYLGIPAMMNKILGGQDKCQRTRL